MTDDRISATLAGQRAGSAIIGPSTTVSTNFDARAEVLRAISTLLVSLAFCCDLPFFHLLFSNAKNPPLPSSSSPHHPSSTLSLLLLNSPRLIRLEWSLFLLFFSVVLY